MKLSTIALAAGVLFAGHAYAQPASLACNGEMTVVRVSKLKPGATLAQFEDAVHDHMAWYRSHGFTQNTQVIGKLVKRDPATRAPVYATDEVVTIHRNSPMGSAVKPDAAWDAYVAKYRKVSDIESEVYACIPKG